MKIIIVATICLIFVVLAFWHFKMALSPTSGVNSAVPSVGGKPLFVPSAGGTVFVGLCLLLCALLIAATGGLLLVAVPMALLNGLSCGLAFGLFARAVGEFNYVGFFKRVRGSRFAVLDTLVYSPLCLILGCGVAFILMHGDS